MVRIEHSGLGFWIDSVIVDVPSGIVRSLFEKGIDLVIGLDSIMLPAAPCRAAENGDTANYAKCQSTPVH
jgi:hypothetical protein